MSTASVPKQRYEVSQTFFFDAAHTLQRQLEAEGSARVHGHTYDAEVAVAGQPDTASGMVLDLGHLRAAVQDLRQVLDHRLLDDVPGLGVPTLENLCAFIAARLQARGISASRVSIWRRGIGDRCDLRLSS